MNDDLMNEFENEMEPASEVKGFDVEPEVQQGSLFDTGKPVKYVVGIDPAIPGKDSMAIVERDQNGIISYKKDNPEAYDGSKQDKVKLDEAGQYAAPNPNKMLPSEFIDTFSKQGFMIVEAQDKIKAWIGIDPGKNGGIVLLAQDGTIKKWVMPKIGTDTDIHALYDIFINLGRYNLTIILEEVHSIYGTSAGSNFAFGFVCGAIEAIVIAHKIRFHKVQPKIWQKNIWVNSDIEYKTSSPKARVARFDEEPKKISARKIVDTKLSSLKACKRLFPLFDLRGTERSKNAHDGIVDALLLAEYGRRNNL